MIIRKTPLFHRRLAQAIAASGMSKLAVAKAIGASANTMRRYLSGRVDPKESVILSLATVLKVDSEWLAGRARPLHVNSVVATYIPRTSSVEETFARYGVDFLSRVNALGDAERVALAQFLRGLTGRDPAIRQHLIGQMRIIDRALGPADTDEEAQHG